MTGVDLCCCTGAGMRFLVRFKEVAAMQGVDATTRVVDLGQMRCAKEDLAEKIRFTLGDACDTGLAGATSDFVWGEDAWCYVEDKGALIAEAGRLVKPGGVIAFTDWIEGSKPMTEAEAERFLTFMKFPNVQDLEGYQTLLLSQGCDVLLAQDTGRFAEYVDLYLDMLNKQLTYDALKTIGFDLPLLQAMGQEMVFMQALAHEGKIAQGLFVARKRD
jgi:SAM-dependent methyltransferase